MVGVNLSLPDTGGARAMQQTYMSTHGMTTANTTVLVDGQMTNGLQGDGAIQSYYNDAMNAEVSYQTAGIGAETSAGGVRLNMIPREGGNRFSGDFKAVSRPGDWQSSNLTDRHKARGLTAGNAIDRIVDYTLALGGPIMKDKLWFFALDPLLLGEQLHRQHVHGRWQPGHRRPVHHERHGAADLAGVAAQQDLGLLRRDRQVPRPRHAGQLRSGDGRARVWNSPAYHTTAIKWTSPVTSSLFLEAGWSNNTEYYTNEYRDGIEKPRGTAEWFANAAKNEVDLGGYTRAGPINTTESPMAFYWNAAATYVTGDHTIKFGANNPAGHLQAHARRQRRPGAAVPQQPAPASAGRCPTAC